MSPEKETPAFGGVFALIAVCAMVLGVVVFAAVAMLAALLTILCFCAWNKPLKLGKITLEPEEARSFVKRGICTACMMPILTIGAFILFDLPVKIFDYMPHIVVFGYILGSLGVEMLSASAQQDDKGTADDTRSQTMPKSIEHAPPQGAKQEYRFATWDDEEKSR